MKPFICHCCFAGLRLNPLYIFLLGLLFYTCTSSSQSAPGEVNSIKKIKTWALDSLISKVPDITIVDVRSQQEVSEGMIHGAIHIDYHQPDFQSKLSQLDRSKPYLIYCLKEGRSGKTCALLNNIGIENLYLLEGGYDAWIKNMKSK
ncbi:MAG TPA: rhodanese-like domain-containing protein [Saprospiraceae bacterium]|nr:rhodanese-like domain-containing protein [Saprospiraceae bacterium]